MHLIFEHIWSACNVDLISPKTAQPSTSDPVQSKLPSFKFNSKKLASKVDFVHFWCRRNLDLWPTDLKIKPVHLCLQVYRTCKFGEIPSSGSQDIVFTSITQTQTDKNPDNNTMPPALSYLNENCAGKPSEYLGQGRVSR